MRLLSVLDCDYMNYVAKTIQLLGGDSAVSRIVNLTPKAVRKWRIAGKLPRTEATGETNYSELIAAVDSRIDQNKLRSTAFKRKVS
jgi:hypothetical protein